MMKTLWQLFLFFICDEAFILKITFAFLLSYNRSAITQLDLQKIPTAYIYRELFQNHIVFITASL